jgi:DNA (cytosine-5)-methyltransferase 1
MVTHPTKRSSVGLNQAIEIAQGILPREFHSWGEVPQSLLRTPAASEAERGHQPVEKSMARGGQVTLSGQMMSYFPTPNTMDHLPARTPEQKAANKGKGGYANVRETVVNDLMPTPKALDGVKGNLKTSEERIAAGNFVDLPNIANDLALIGTPRATASESSSTQVKANAPKGRIEDQALTTNWGKFEPAIRRWEATIGRTAPAPTKADGKDGAHRLSSSFTEWMMGIPENWVTGHGLSRNDELKMCGNGVVPQQAALALRILLDGLDLPSGGGQVNLPTPTVSDTFTDNLKSSQQKEGSMHSVTLPQVVKMLHTPEL